MPLLLIKPGRSLIHLAGRCVWMFLSFVLAFINHDDLIPPICWTEITAKRACISVLCAILDLDNMHHLLDPTDL